MRLARDGSTTRNRRPHRKRHAPAASRARSGPSRTSSPSTSSRTAGSFVWATSRASPAALPTPPGPGPYLQALKLLGMPLWQPAGPNGFSDSSDAWASPEGMKTRLALAYSMGQRMGGAAEPLDVLRTALGDTASTETRQAVERANRANRRLRSCSWLQNSSGDDDDNDPWPYAPHPLASRVLQGGPPLRELAFSAAPASCLRRRAPLQRAIRASSSSSCAAPSTDCLPLRRSAIRITRGCAAILPSPHPVKGPGCAAGAQHHRNALRGGAVNRGGECCAAHLLERGAALQEHRLRAEVSFNPRRRLQHLQRRWSSGLNPLSRAWPVR